MIVYEYHENKMKDIAMLRLSLHKKMNFSIKDFFIFCAFIFIHKFLEFIYLCKSTLPYVIAYSCNGIKWQKAIAEKFCVH